MTHDSADSDSSVVWGRPAVVAGGLIHASLVTGASGAGDIGAQTADVLARLARALGAAGSTLAKAVSVQVFLQRASDFAAMNAAYRRAFAAAPPARTTIVAGVPGGALVAMSAVAVVPAGRRDGLLPDGWVASPRPYSYGIRTDELVFFSGLLSRRPADDQTVAGDISVQVRTILENAGELLEAADLGYDDVVAARVFLTNRADFDAMTDLYGTYFGKGAPARSTVIAPLVGPDASVEITLVAAAGEKTPVGEPGPAGLASPGVRAGRRVFLAGVLGNTEGHDRDAVAQAREALARAGHRLQAAGLTFADVVDSTWYFRHLSDAARVAPVFQEVFPRDPPAVTVVGAPLVPPSALVEVVLTAYR